MNCPRCDRPMSSLKSGVEFCRRCKVAVHPGKPTIRTGAVSIPGTVEFFGKTYREGEEEALALAALEALTKMDAAGVRVKKVAA